MGGTCGMDLVCAPICGTVVRTVLQSLDGRHRYRYELSRRVRAEAEMQLEVLVVLLKPTSDLAVVMAWYGGRVGYGSIGSRIRVPLARRRPIE
jgi:hypothetical protein